MHFIDTHSHLYLPDFDTDIDEVIRRAHEHHIDAILLPNIDSTSVERMKNLCRRFPDTCYPMMGLHPTSVKENYTNELALVEQELKKGGYIAVGEIGIDLYWDQTFKKEQIDAFACQIRWARELNLPFIIHSRNAFPEVFRVLEHEADGLYRGVFHAFSGTAEDAERAVSMGFKLGIGGVVTYKKAGLDKTIEAIGYQHLVLETDAPYLSPVPKRGKRNESAYLVYSAARIAEVCGIPLDELAMVTTRNAMEVFRLPVR